MKKWNIKENEEKLEKDTNDGIIGIEEKIENSKKWTFLAGGAAVIIVAVILVVLIVTDTI